MANTDITPLYIPEKQTAQLLGRSIDWLRQNKKQLEDQFGFPRVDPATGYRHRPSIEAWADERNRRNQASHIEQVSEIALIGNYDEF